MTTLSDLYYAPKVKTVNRRVAVEPFPDMSVKTTAQGQGAVKVARIENKVTLTQLTIVFPSEDGRFSPGDMVLVRSSLYVQGWAKERHEIDGKSFILIPESDVEAIVKRPE